jgi:hypothetical protein
MSATDVLNSSSPSGILAWLSDPNAPQILSRLGVKYVIVPTDPLGELFLTDRTYDSQKRASWVAAVGANGWLSPEPQFLPLTVFSTPAFASLFFVDEDVLQPSRVPYTFLSPVEYEVQIPPHTGQLGIIFSQKYDPHWVMRQNAYQIRPEELGDGLMKFTVPVSREGRFTVFYGQQQFVWWGTLVSGLTLLGLVGGEVFQRISIRKRV